MYWSPIYLSLQMSLAVKGAELKLITYLSKLTFSMLQDILRNYNNQWKKMEPAPFVSIKLCMNIGVYLMLRRQNFL